MNKTQISWPDLALALGVVGLGIFFVIGALGLDASPGYAKVGSKFFPIVVAIGLIVTGALLALAALRGERAEPASEEDADPNAPTNWAAFAWITAAFVIGYLLLKPVGFILVAASMFFCTARAFGSKQILRDAIVAVLLSAATFFLFTRGLSLPLPVGTVFGGF